MWVFIKYTQTSIHAQAHRRARTHTRSHTRTHALGHIWLNHNIENYHLKLYVICDVANWIDASALRWTKWKQNGVWVCSSKRKMEKRIILIRRHMVQTWEKCDKLMWHLIGFGLHFISQLSKWHFDFDFALIWRTNSAAIFSGKFHDFCHKNRSNSNVIRIMIMNWIFHAWFSTAFVRYYFLLQAFTFWALNPLRFGCFYVQCEWLHISE